MKSEWRVSSQVINSKNIYTVYRLRDTTAINHSGNREYSGTYFTDQDAAEALALKLNEQGGTP